MSNPGAIHDPCFSAAWLEERLKLIWFQLKTALLTRDTRYIRSAIAPEVLNRLLGEGPDSDGFITVPSRGAVLRLTLSDITVRDGMEHLRCSMTTKSRRMQLNPQTGATKWLDKRDVVCEETWSLRRPAGTQTPPEETAFDTHCEGCGAAVVLYRDTTCPFCKAFIKVPDFTWTVCEIDVKRTR